MKVLVIGLGSMGKRRIRNLLANNVKDIIGFDINQLRRQEILNIQENKEMNIEVFSKIEDAMAKNPEAIIISTPPNLHIEYAIMAANLNIPFFTEAGTCLKGMERLIDLIKNKKIIAAPSCTLRFHPSIIKIKEIILNKTIGVPLAFTHHCGQYLPDWHPWEDYRTFYVSKKETGACREIVPFELNWLVWLFGWPNLINGFKAKVSDLDCDIDDIYQMVLNYNQKLMGHLQVDVIARTPTRFLRILLSQGTIEWNMPEKNLRIYYSDSKSWQTITEDNLAAADGYSTMSVERMYIDEIGRFLKAIRGEEKFPHTFEDDMKILNSVFSFEHRSSYVQGNTQKTLINEFVS